MLRAADFRVRSSRRQSARHETVGQTEKHGPRGKKQDRIEEREASPNLLRPPPTWPSDQGADPHRNRYPLPTTVSIGSGSPSLRRRRAMVTVTVRLNGSACSSHTRSKRSSALTIPAVGDHEHLEHADLLAGQRNRAPGPAHPPASAVEDDVAPDRDRRRCRCPPGEGVDPGHKLFEGERFGQIVVRPEVEPLDPVADAARRSQHEDPGFRGGAYQCRTHGIAMNPWAGRGPRRPRRRRS